MDLNGLFSGVVFVTAGLMVLLILLQQRGTSLGSGFGASGELFTTRRGLDRSLFTATIVVAVVFIMSVVALLLI